MHQLLLSTINLEEVLVKESESVTIAEVRIIMTDGDETDDDEPEPYYHERWNY